VDGRKLAAALAIMLLAPCPPLLFMGEEWGSTKPFPFFCDFKGALADAVRQGRKREFREAYATMGDEIPDPLLKETFESAVLDWSEPETPQGRARLTLVRDLLNVRRREVTPYLSSTAFGSAQHEDGMLTARWRLADGRSLLLLANLSDGSAFAALPMHKGRAIWGGEPGHTLAPWSVHWSIGAD
jgi:maltooligosyltrehalose trehalohydrolase